MVGENYVNIANLLRGAICRERLQCFLLAIAILEQRKLLVYTAQLLQGVLFGSAGSRLFDRRPDDTARVIFFALSLAAAGFGLSGGSGS